MKHSKGFILLFLFIVALALMACGSGEAPISQPTPKVGSVRLLSPRGRDYLVEVTVPQGKRATAITLRYAGTVDAGVYADNCTPITCVDTRVGHTWGGFPQGSEYRIQEAGGDPLPEGTYTFQVQFTVDWAPDLMDWDIEYKE